MSRAEQSAWLIEHHFFKEHMTDKLLENFFLLAAGIALIIYSLYTLRKLRYFIKIEAACIDSKEEYFHTSDSVERGSKRTFSFQYKGINYTARETNYLGRKSKEGSVHHIYINPNAPAEILTISQITNYIFFLLMGVIIIIVSIL